LRLLSAVVLHAAWRFITGDDETLGVVDFSIFPHVDHPDLPENTMAEAQWRYFAAWFGAPKTMGPERSLGPRDWW